MSTTGMLPASRSLWPQAVHRAHCRSLSLEVFGPHRMTGTAQAIGAECRHFSQ
jgi:hypothetical protein